MCPFSDLYIISITVLISERTWYRLHSTFTTISYHHHFYDYYTGVNFTFSYIFSVIPCVGADPKNDFNNSNMDCWDHPWCVENISRHLTRSLLLPFPRTSLQGPACWPVHHTAYPCTKTSRDSWIWSFRVDTTIPVQCKFFRDTIQIHHAKVREDISNNSEKTALWQGYVGRGTNYARFATPIKHSKLTRGFKFLEYWQNLFIAWEYSLNWFQSEWGLFTVRLSKWIFPILDFNWYLKTSFNIERWVFSMISIFIEETWINILFTQNAPTP